MVVGHGWKIVQSSPLDNSLDNCFWHWTTSKFGAFGGIWHTLRAFLGAQRHWGSLHAAKLQFDDSKVLPGDDVEPLGAPLGTSVRPVYT